MAEAISFQPVREEDFPILNTWLQTPHVAKWWYPDILPWPEFVAKYRKNLESTTVFAYLILLDTKAIGFIQAYDAAAEPDDAGLCDPPGTWGMDLYIADANYLGKGYGPRIINALMSKLQAEHQVKKFIIDPHLENHAAIRAYEKAGFKAVREGQQAYGKVLWMEKLVGS